jgi:hypothetical protein
MYFSLTKLTPCTFAKLFLPPIQNTEEICKQITILIFHKVSSWLVTLKINLFPKYFCPLLKSSKRIHSGLRPHGTFHNMVSFFQWGVVSPPPNTQPGSSAPLTAERYYLLYIFTVTLNFLRPSSPPTTQGRFRNKIII